MIRRITLLALGFAATMVANAQSFISGDMQQLRAIVAPPEESRGVVLTTISTEDGQYAVVKHGSSLSVLKFDLNGQVVSRASELNAASSRVWVAVDPNGGLFVLGSDCTLLSYSVDLQNRFRVDAEAPSNDKAHGDPALVKQASLKAATAKGGFACNGMALNQGELLVQSFWPTQALLRFSTEGQFLDRVNVTQNALPASVHYLNQLGDKLLVSVRNGQDSPTIQALNSALQPAWQFSAPAGQSDGYVLAKDGNYAVIRTYAGNDYALSIINSQGALIANVVLPPVDNLERWYFEFGTLWFEVSRYVAGQNRRTFFAWRAGEPLQVIYEGPNVALTAISPIDADSAVIASSTYSAPYVEAQTIRRISRMGLVLDQSTQNANHFVTEFLRLPNAQWRIFGEKARRFAFSEEILGMGKFRLGELDVQDFQPILLPALAGFGDVAQASGRTFVLTSGTLSALDSRGRILWQREGNWQSALIASEQGVYVRRSDELVHIDADGQDLWAQPMPVGCGMAQHKHANLDAVWAYCLTNAVPAQLKLIQVSADRVQEFASFPQAPNAGDPETAIFDLDGFGNATELQQQPRAAERRSGSGAVLWRIALQPQEMILVSDNTSITTRLRINSRQFVYTQRHADGLVVWQHNVQTPCELGLLLPNLNALHEACNYNPNEPLGTLRWHTISDTALAVPFKSIGRVGLIRLRDILDSPNGDQWLHAESAQSASNRVFRVNAVGTVLEEWRANASFAQSFSSRNLWQTEHGVFMAIEANVPGLGEAVQIYRASDELHADGFE